QALGLYGRFMEHFVEIFKSLVWPVTILIIAYKFQNETKGLIGRISSLKVGDAEAEFANELNQVEDEYKEIISTQPEIKEVGKSDFELNEKTKLERISEVSPRAAITEAWALVEEAAMSSGLVQGSTIRKVSPKQIMDCLKDSGHFSDESINVINSLRQLRNKAAHNYDIQVNQDEANRFTDLAVRSSLVIKDAGMKEYREKLGIADNHILVKTSSEWKVKKGQDTDTYEFEEHDENGNIVATYTLYDSTSTYPPFSRTITFDKH
uniref:hypothetical protein n=1 Tax=uncultured Photobacterium sp. TaxID=173973 RepID=UPI0026100633